MKQRHRGPPITDNTIAQRLIADALQQCEGCRRSWRLRGWMHGGQPKSECTAQFLRGQLRSIAAENREREKARKGTCNPR